MNYMASEVRKTRFTDPGQREKCHGSLAVTLKAFPHSKRGTMAFQPYLGDTK